MPTIFFELISGLDRTETGLQYLSDSPIFTLFNSLIVPSWSLNPFLRYAVDGLIASTMSSFVIAKAGTD